MAQYYGTKIGAKTLRNPHLGCDHIGVYGIRYTMIRFALRHIQVMQRGSSGISSDREQNVWRIIANTV